MKYRYPGIHSFTADERALFFGRDREIKELFRLIVLNEVVVLFGKSGTGKTSLLQAGVGPLLSERLLEPVKLRLNNTHQPISRQIYEQFNDGEYLPLDTPDTLSLWEYCKLFEHHAGGERYTPVLLFDQFEELFTLYHDRPEMQQDFIGQLADVLNGKIPAAVLEKSKSVADLDERARYLAPPQVNIVISIRSDYLYLLDRLSGSIPTILRCRYELQSLDEANTRLAITRPSAKQGSFASPAFTYSEDALQGMVDSLTAGGEGAEGVMAPAGREVEPFQAQLLCRYIEQKIIDEKCPPGFEVTPAFYGGREGIEDIRSQFYAGVLDKFDAGARLRIQRLVEELLLSNDRRIIQERDFLRLECSLGEEDLTLLCADRLLKEEPRGGSFYYEISHDTLVAPIVKAREARLLAEEADRLEQERRDAEARARDAEFRADEEKRRAEEARRLQDEAEKQEKIAQKAKRRANWFAWGAGVLALIAVVLAIWAINQSQKAQYEQARAEAALESQKKALADVVRLNLADADRMIYHLDFEAARKKIRAIQSLGVSEKEVSDALLEFAFWYAETGDFDRTWQVLDTAYRLAGRNLPVVQDKNREDARAAIRELNPARDSFLQARYFPIMADIPGGTDTIGGNYNARFKVTISPFQMAQTETTWWQYMLFCVATRRETPDIPGWGVDGDNPVVNVSWYDAVDYTNWLSDRGGIPRAITVVSDKTYSINLKAGYRLPTEAEWEYAARSGTENQYAGCNNEEDLGKYAWYQINSGSRTRQVKTREKNGNDLYDMSGNVREWCWDWHEDNPGASQTDPKGPGQGVYRVSRGGSWGLNAGYCRVASRIGDWPAIRGNDVGFRLVLQL